MSWIVTKKPDGLYAIWSTIVDDFIADELTVEGVARCYAERAHEDAELTAREAVARANREPGKHAELMAWRDEVHGEEESDDE